MGAKKVTFPNKEDYVTNDTIPDKNKVNASDINKIKEAINEHADEIDAKTGFKTDGNVQNELLLSSSRSEPTNKLLVQMKDANGKVVYIEADASNTYLASGETVENCLSRAVFLQPLE